MPAIFPGRFTARTDQPFVVFLIGMNINKLWQIHHWLPAFNAMAPMLNELYRHPEKGFLGGTFAFTLSGPLAVQYWRTFEDLERFARSPEDPHLPAWRRFNQAARQGGAVGVWHETYLVGQGGYEAMYVNMPRFGLAGAVEHCPIVPHSDTARRRLDQSY